MKRLRAESSSASWRRMSSRVRASSPISSGRPTGKRALKSPAATRRAPASTSPHAARQPLRHEEAEEEREPAGDPPGDETRRRTTSTLASTSRSGLEKTTTWPTWRRPVSGLRNVKGCATWPTRPFEPVSVPRAVRPVRAASTALGNSRLTSSSAAESVPGSTTPRCRC
jgi:hypothetical protein